MAKAAVKKTSPAKPAPLSFWQNDLKAGLVLAGIAFLLYLSSVGYGYALDDSAVIAENNYVHEGFAGFGKILSTFYWNGYPPYAMANSGLFRPVSLLLFATEWQFAPGHPGFYHFVNVLLYAACAFLLYRALREMLRNQPVTLPLLATLAWIVLPVHTEVVANIKSADELLSLLFSLLALRQLLKWSDHGKVIHLVISAAYFFIALLSKEGAVLFYPVLLLALFLFRGKTIRQLLLPAGILAAVTLAWFGWHASVIAGAQTEMIPYDYRNNALRSSPSFTDRLGTAIGMQAHYWWKMLVGYPLSYNYSYNEIPVEGFASVWTWAALAGIGLAIYFAVKNFRSAPVVSFALLFYFITFALTSNIFYLIGDTFAERFTFVPSIGFTLLLAWLVLKFTGGLSEKRLHAKAVYVLLPLVLVYSIRTFARSQSWKEESILFTADVDHAPGSARVHDNYAVLQLTAARNTGDAGQKKLLTDDAYTHFRTAAAIDSLDFQAALSLADIEFSRGNYRNAIYWAQKNIAIFPFFHAKPNDKAVYSILGTSYMELHQYDSAFSVFSNAAKLHPQDENFQVALGGYSLALHDTAQAIAYYEKATLLNPGSVTAWDKLANVCGMSGRYELSSEAFLQVTRLKPDDPHAWQMLYKNARLQKDTVKMREYEQEYYRHGGK